MNLSKHDILIGDARQVLYELPESIAHVCVTSPPYWRLRDYGSDSPLEIGQESTLEDHLANLVDVFRAVRHVLRPDGTLWLNYGDAFSQGGNADTPSQKQRSNRGSVTMPATKPPPGFKPKDRLLLPHRLAMALQEDGWYLRAECVWCKKTPMPESVAGSHWVRHQVPTGERDFTRPKKQGTHPGNHFMLGDDYPMDSSPVMVDCPGCPKCEATDGYVFMLAGGRPTTAHEYVFLLTPSADYYYAQHENRVAAKPWTSWGQPSAVKEHNGDGRNARFSRHNQSSGTRNLWSYWTDIKPGNCKQAHFATMPTDLAARCIKLGTSSRGVCPTCGNQWAPIVKRERTSTRPGTNSKINRASQHDDSVYHSQSGTIIGNRDPQRHSTDFKIVGHRPTCHCGADPAPALVLDPFGGAGTTAIAARMLGHSSLICELNPEYAELARTRMRSEVSRSRSVKLHKPAAGQRELF